MSLQNITITGSIKSIATQSYDQRTYISSTEEQSFPIETITGSQAGTWPNFVPDTNYTVDLIVNVTQSWSGSNISPSGIIPYVHDTMDEFYNGEFSGSAYTVTNGSLIDAQCEQFLTVNTTPTNYSIFPYKWFYSFGDPSGVYLESNEFNVFINNLTAPPNGGILLFETDIEGKSSSRNVKIRYLKISRFDKEGNDNTLSLQELTNIKWTDSVLGIIDLKILTISEYPTYYLYAVESKTWINPGTFPIDDNILNYSLSASFIGPSASAGLMYLDDWDWDPTKISGGTFNGVWTFDVTPNITTRYTASITAYNGNASPVTFDFSFVGNTYVGSTTYFTIIAQTQSVSIPSLQSKTFTLKSTVPAAFIGNPDVQYHLETKNLTAPVSLSNTFWIITQSVAPQLSTSSVVLEPYLLSTFTNSDCDVLMNNASQNDISTNYREVIYDTGGTIPSNLQQIIDHTAEFAQVNDYIFSARSSTIPRFEGSRTTSPDINLPYVSGFSNKELSILDTSSLNLTASNLPNIDITTPYFAYFEKVSSPLPRSLYGSKLTVTRLVDAGGTSLPLDGSNTNLFSLENIFKQYSSASIFFIATTDSSSNANNNIETTIIDTGVDYKNIFYFQPTSNNLGNTRTSAIYLRLLALNTNPAQPNPYYYKTWDNTTVAPFAAYYNLLSLTSGSPNLVSFKYTNNGLFSFPFTSNGLNNIRATNPYQGTGYMVGLGLTLKTPYPSNINYTNYNDYPWISFLPNSAATYYYSSSLFPIRAGDYIRVWNVTQGIGSNAVYGSSYPDNEVLLTSQLYNSIDGVPSGSEQPPYTETKQILSIETEQSGLFYPKYGIIPPPVTLVGEDWPTIVDNPIVTIDVSSSIYTSNGAQDFIWASQNYSSSLINDIAYSTYYNKFIAVGDNGLIITSSDGRDWGRFIPTALNNALPNFNEKLTAISINSSSVYIVGDNSLILNNDTSHIGPPYVPAHSLEDICTSSLWDSKHPYPDSRYSFTSVCNAPDDSFSDYHNTALIGGYDNLLNSGSLVGYNNSKLFTSASFSKLTNINGVYIQPDVFNNSGYYGIGAAVGDDGLIISIENTNNSGSTFIAKNINQVSRSLKDTGAGYPGISNNLYSVDVRTLDASSGGSPIFAVGESGSWVYYTGLTTPFADPTEISYGLIGTDNLRKIKRFETGSNDTLNYLLRYKESLVLAEYSSYITVGDNGFIAYTTSSMKNNPLPFYPDSWQSSSIVGNNLKSIAVGEIIPTSLSEVKLNVDSPWGSNFPYGTYDNQINNTALQGFRIFRGEASDQGIYIADNIPDGVGFIIPGNYNPEYNYLEVARKAGLITG